MTIAPPSRLAVADIKWLVREFQIFPLINALQLLRSEQIGQRRGLGRWALEVRHLV